MAKRVLVTGSKGFIGTHLISDQNDFEVISSAFDLLDFSEIQKTIEQVRPDIVLHLAALSLPAQCDQNPAVAYQVNLSGTALLLEAMLRAGSKARFIFASTAQVYRPLQKGQEVPITEEHPIEPINLYARTKRMSEEVVREYSEKYAIRSCILRIFNHVHHTQKSGTFLSSIYQEVLAQKVKSQKIIIPVGNLDLYRDMGAVRDLLGAIVAVVQHESSMGAFEVLNVCSGIERNLRELSSLLVKEMGVEAEFKIDPSRIRQNDPHSILGSHDRLTHVTGWKPTTISNLELIQSFLK